VLVGSDFVPKDDQSEFEVAITLPEGYTLARASDTCRELEARFQQLPGVTNVFTTIGPTAAPRRARATSPRSPSTAR
jgi:HAE1 family hydrophobic/amphiphilic exporter-1